jgi:hypothetical protein
VERGGDWTLQRLARSTLVGTPGSGTIDPNSLGPPGAVAAGPPPANWNDVT